MANATGRAGQYQDRIFPQANNLTTVIDLVAAACHSPRLDEAEFAAMFGIEPRQGAYYFSAAERLGLAYKRGGWIKATPAGERINAMGREGDRRLAIYALILKLPVFQEAAAYAADNGCLPTQAELAAWVRKEDPKVNHTTGARRAQTVANWIREILAEAPELLPSTEPDVGVGMMRA